MTLTTSPTGDLYERLIEVLGTRDVHPDDRIAIQGAFFEGATWADLPADVQQLIVDAEASPRQAWDDPADLPENLDELN